MYVEYKKKRKMENTYDKLNMNIVDILLNHMVKPTKVCTGNSLYFSKNKLEAILTTPTPNKTSAIIKLPSR